MPEKTEKDAKKGGCQPKIKVVPGGRRPKVERKRKNWLKLGLLTGNI